MTEAVPFNRLSIQWQEIAAAAEPEISEVFAKSAFSHGPYVERFERKMEEWLGIRHAIAVSSGTAALHLAMIAAGIKAGDEVLVPAHTFIASVWGILYAGATPVFCDVEDATGNIDMADAERRVTPRTTAVIPVHLYGQPADLDAVAALARRHGLKVIEDNAQSVGARWNGRQLGTHGLMGCFSFYPGKNLGAAGEGGLVTTSDDAIAEHLRRLRNHGQSERYIHADIGYNYRMDGIQGVVLGHKIGLIEAWTARRKDLAVQYTTALAGAPLRLPETRHQDHVWHLYVVRTPRRNELRSYLQKLGIETGLHYPCPNHLQPALAHVPRDSRGYPNAEAWANECLSLPLFYGMADDQIQRVASAVRAFF